MGGEGVTWSEGVGGEGVTWGEGVGGDTFCKSEFLD